MTYHQEGETMDNPAQREHSTGQDDVSAAAQVTPQQRRLVALMQKRTLFAALVDDLEPSPTVWLLKAWGAARGVYPAERTPPPPPLEELEAWLSRWTQKGSTHR
jgi:hypothetical protein